MADGINVKIGADLTEFEAKYSKLITELNAGQKSMATNAEQAAARQIRSIEEQIAAEQLFSSTEAKGLLVKERAVAMSKFVEAAEKAEARAKIENAEATRIADGATLNFKRTAAQLLVILKDLARGQWARAFSTFSTLLQGLGVSLGFILGILVPIIAVGYGVIKLFKELGEGAQYLADSINSMTTRLRAEADAMRDAAKEAANFAEWLERLHEIRNEQSMTRDADEDVKAMHKRFEMEQRAARARGQTPRQAMDAQKREAHAEANVYKQYAALAGQDADAAEAAATKAEAKNAPLIAKKKADLKVSSQAAQHAASVLAEASEAFGLQTSGGKLERLFMSKGLAGTLSILGDKKDQKLELANGKFVTLNEALKQYDATRRQETADEATLTPLEKELEDAKRKADKTAHDAATLKAKATGAQESADALNDVDTNVPGREHPHMIMTELQRVGAFIGPSAGDEMLRVQRGIARNVASINSHLSRNAKTGHREEHVPGF